MIQDLRNLNQINNLSTINNNITGASSATMGFEKIALLTHYILSSGLTRKYNRKAGEIFSEGFDDDPNSDFDAEEGGSLGRIGKLTDNYLGNSIKNNGISKFDTNSYHQNTSVRSETKVKIKKKTEEPKHSEPPPKYTFEKSISIFKLLQDIA